MAALLLAVSLGAGPAFAGGALEQIDITGNVPSPIAGHVVGKLVPIFWDARCIPVRYLVNSTLDPIPNPLPPGTPVITLADATAAFQQAFDSWNNIPTSYIDMRITGTVANTGLRRFDFKNELTFRTAASFAAIASSPSVTLIADTTFTPGLDIDGDGDSDVSAAISVCQDTDADGDIEFPAGLYQAGTILDNDVQYNTKVSNGLRFTVAAAAADTVTRSVDLEGVAAHEDGHSHGLSHVVDNNESATDGNGVTMFPFIDTGDPAAELAQRTLDSDDIAWSSFFYQEGTASSGPAALQAGDQKFEKVYGVIRGNVHHGVLDQDVAGASVYALDDRTGTFMASGFSGTTQVSVSPTGGLFLVNVPFNILDGKYAIPVREGKYKVGIEAMDGNPVPAANVSLTGQIGSIFGQLNFNEEFWNEDDEAAIEEEIGEAEKVEVEADDDDGGHHHKNGGGHDHGDDDDGSDEVDFITNADIRLANFGTRDFVGFTLSPAGRYYAVQIPASQITAILPGEDILIQAGLFDTFVADASVVPRFAEATLTTGTVTGATASLNLSKPLARTTGFVGADNDFAPLYFKNPDQLGEKVRKGISKGDIQNLFLVLRLPTTTPFPGVSALPPLIGLDGGVAVNDVPIFGLSFTSDDGGVTFNQIGNFNFRFSLLLSPEPPDDDDDDDDD